MGGEILPKSRNQEQKDKDWKDADDRSQLAAKIGKDKNLMQNLIDALDNKQEDVFKKACINKLKNSGLTPDDLEAFVGNLWEDTTSHQDDRHSSRPCW